jgi:hypothetical protein
LARRYRPPMKNSNDIGRFQETRLSVPASDETALLQHGGSGILPRRYRGWKPLPQEPHFIAGTKWCRAP